MMSVGISKACFKANIGDIEEVFRYTYSQQQLSKLFDAIHGYSPKNLKDAVTHLINTNQPNRPPSNAEIIHAVRDYWRQDWEEMKSKEDRAAKSFQHGDYPVKNEHARESLQLIRQILSTKNGSLEPLLSHAEIITFMREMRTKYPGNDWNEYADKLEKYYERRERAIDASVAGVKRDLPPGIDTVSERETPTIRPAEVEVRGGDEYVPPW